MQADHLHAMEEEVLGAVIGTPGVLGTAFVESLDPGRFSGWRATLATCLHDMLADGMEVGVTAVAERLRTTGQAARCSAVQVFDAYQAGGRVINGLTAIDRLRNVHLQKDVGIAGMRLQQMAETSDVGTAIDYMQTEGARLAKIEAGRVTLDTPDLFTFLNAGSAEIDWAIPGLLPAATSLMVTAEEGLGKSVLLRQIAVAATLGLDPFMPEVRDGDYRPQRALIIDCEVSENQLRRSLNRVWAHASRFHPEAAMLGKQNLAVISVQAGLDLSRPEDQGLLRGWVRSHRPEVLVIGPVYRMSATDVNEEEGVRAWQRPLEAIMAEGCSVVLEHHSPNESAGTRRALRPIGSSAIRRWSAQGVSLSAIKCNAHDALWCRVCGRKAEVGMWRGSRDETDWPTHLRSPRDSVWWARDEFAENGM